MASTESTTPVQPRPRARRRPRIYVAGHRNPDTDSVAAAVGYAELKQRQDPDTEYIPVRLGDLNPQTTWVLEQAGLEAPRLMSHIRLRAGDVMREDFPVVSCSTALRHAGHLMVASGIDLLPVVDDEGLLVGALTERALARRYVRESLETSHLDAPTPVTTIAEVLDGEVLTEGVKEVGGREGGRVWVLARDTAKLLQTVMAGDIAVVGDRYDAQLRAIELGVSVLVVSNGTDVPDATLDAARKADVQVIATPLDSYVAARMITLAEPCRTLADEAPMTVRERDMLEDISDDIKDVAYRAAVVVDRRNAPIGLVTRADLVDPPRRKVILVDHAELKQSVPGVEEAEIVEILDHHHIGSVETTNPIRATFDPVGSTATLVAERFRAHDEELSDGLATLLLAAVLSDTVVLNSPTTTDRDRAVARRLAEQLGRDVEDFGRAMFEASSDVAGVDPDVLVARDAKAYDLAGGLTIAIAQVEVVGSAILQRVGDLQQAAQARLERDGHRLYALMITDVVEKSTQLLVAGDVALAEKAFGKAAVDHVIDLPGVMSRKKQVAPPLLKAA